MTPLLAHKLDRDPTRAFEAIYRHHLRDVYGFSLGILANVQDAEDVTQTTFLNAYRALERGEKVENVRAWLLAIAHNVCRQRFRAATRRPQEAELNPELAEAAPDDGAPSAHEIRDAMGHLGFNQRTILVLREIQGLTYEQIAETMGLSLSAVETLLFRARQAMREQLEAIENDLGCDAVQRLISLQLDGRLSRQDRRLLRAHLRACPECARFSRSQRVRKQAMPSLVAVPIPLTLTGAFEAGAGSILASKAVAAALAAALVTTGALITTGVLPLPDSSSAAEARVQAGEKADLASTPTERASLMLQRESGAARAHETTARAGKQRDVRTGTRIRTSKPRPGVSNASVTAGGVAAVEASGGGGSPTGDAAFGASAGTSASGGQAAQTPGSAESPSRPPPNPVATAAQGMVVAAQNVVAAAQNQTEGGRGENVVAAAQAMVGAAQNVVDAAHDKKTKP